MQVTTKHKFTVVLLLVSAMALAACGDTPTSTLVPLPSTVAGAADTTTRASSNNNSTTTNASSNSSTTSTGNATNNGAAASAADIPVITGTTEVQINATDFANANGFLRGNAPANGVQPLIKIYSSTDNLTTLEKNAQDALTAAGYTRARFGAGRGANGGTPPANFTPRGNFTPPANFTPGANGRGFGGGGGGIFQKDGAPDILYNGYDVPADSAAMANNRFFSNLPQDVAQKLFDQLKGKKSFIVVTAASGLAQSIGNRPPGQGFNGTPGQGNGTRGGGGSQTPTPTTN